MIIVYQMPFVHVSFFNFTLIKNHHYLIFSKYLIGIDLNIPYFNSKIIYYETRQKRSAK